MTFGEHCAQALKSAKRNNPGLGWDEVARIIEEQRLLWNEPDAPKADPSLKPMSRADIHACYLALCAGCGIPAETITKPMKRAVALAITEIRRVEPELTPRKIAIACERYRNKFRDSAYPNAVSKWWGTLMGGPATAAAKVDKYVEPQNWHQAAIRKFGEDVGRRMIALGWAEIRVNYGDEILKAI